MFQLPVVKVSVDGLKVAPVSERFNVNVACGADASLICTVWSMFQLAEVKVRLAGVVTAPAEIVTGTVCVRGLLFTT